MAVWRVCILCCAFADAQREHHTMQEFDWSLQPLFVNYAAPVIQSVIVIVAAWVLHHLILRGLGRLTASGYFTDPLANTTASISKWLLAIIVILLVLGFFGVSVTSLWATLSGIAALIALGFVAMWSVLSHVSCSILLVVFSPFRIGDEIEVQDPTATVIMRGRVIGINMMFTTLQAIDEVHGETENLIRIPNNIFFQKYTRILPGRGTTSLKKYLAEQHRQQEAR